MNEMQPINNGNDDLQRLDRDAQSVLDDADVSAMPGPSDSAELLKAAAVHEMHLVEEIFDMLIQNGEVDLTLLLPPDTPLSGDELKDEVKVVRDDIVNTVLNVHLNERPKASWLERGVQYSAMIVDEFCRRAVAMRGIVAVRSGAGQILAAGPSSVLPGSGSAHGEVA